jgi:hypothetical protein
LTEAASETALDTRVPTCPDWALRDLAGHIGSVHQWATGFVAEGRKEPSDEK